MPEPLRAGAVLEHCRGEIRRGSKSFAAAARLFDPRTRDHAYLLYAWCRHCDDVIDGEQLGFRAGECGGQAGLARLVAATQCALDGEPATDPAFAALQRVVVECQIPARYPLELIEGFAMDVEGRCNETLEDLMLYCYHVAGVVGVMMAHVMGARDEACLQRATDLGLALQMTNVARDVLDDHASGRIYLPQTWLRAAGVPPAELAQPQHRAGLVRVVGRLLNEADRYYRSGTVGLCALPWRSAWAVAAARNVYREIGQLVRQRGPGAWERRCIVGRSRKLAGVAAAGLEAFAARGLRSLRGTTPRDDLWVKSSPERD